MTESIARKTAKNSIYSIIANGWYLISRFLLTPFVLMYLNLEEYGLWMLCFVAVSFLALSSMGFESTYIKFVAEYHARDEIDRTNRLLSTGLVISTLFSFSIIVVVWAGMDLFLDLLKIEPHMRETASLLLLGTCLVFMLDISFNCFGRALDGMQYMHLTARVRLTTSFIEIILVIIFLLSGLGIFGMLAAFLIRYILAIIINTYFAYKLVPGLKISASLLDKPSLKLLLKYGGKLQFLGFIGIFMTTYDKLIITRFLGLAPVGLYEIGRKIPYTATTIPAEISGALMPALSHLQGKGSNEETYRLFVGASRYMAMIAAPLFTFIFVSAPYALYTWVGEGYDEATGVMYIISAGIFINLLTGASSSASTGLNKLNWQVRYAVINFVLCILMAPIGAHWFGLLGAATGVALSTIIASIYFIFQTNRYFKISTGEYFHQVLHPILATFMMSVGFYFLFPMLITIGTTSRWTSGIILIVCGFLHLILSAVILFVSKGVQPVESKWIRENVEKFKKKKASNSKST